MAQVSLKHKFGVIFGEMFNKFGHFWSTDKLGKNVCSWSAYLVYFIVA